MSVGIDRHLLGLQLIAASEGDHTVFARDSVIIIGCVLIKVNLTS